MSLTEYQRKRRFNSTPEPRGKQARSKSGRLFVVQKHAASRLHYDFRLELDGVLKSWAVPKGPSLDPHEKRLAVQVEDHPIEYGDFEGVIPAGEYGGGTVIVWDQGTWQPVGEAEEGFRAGRLKFQLQGSKLRGGWMLVRMPPRSGESAENWLLIKERDDEARAAKQYDITREQPDSALSGRTLADVAASPDRVWASNSKPTSRADDSLAGRIRAAAKKKAIRATTTGPAKPTVKKKAAAKQKPATKASPTKLRTVAKRTASPKATSSRAKKKRLSPAALDSARKSPLPDFIEPQLATLARQTPQGDRWLHEIKFDGYRILAQIEHGAVRLWSRNAQEWTARFGQIAEHLSHLSVDSAWLDGELIALDSSGISSFQRLQNVLRERSGSELVYQAFDLLYLDGYDLRGAPIERRKNLLEQLLAASQLSHHIRYTEHYVGDGPEFFRQVARLGLEGIICKQAGRPYRSGRTTEWLKIKCVQREEFVVGGFTEPSGSRQGLGALLVGYFDNQRQLRYAGKVGTGFNDAILSDLRSRLDPLERTTSPFIDAGLRKTPRGTHWVAPQLVAQVEFTQWTDDNLLRHPSFQGLREDKPASQVQRDTPRETSTVNTTPPSKIQANRDEHAISAKGQAVVAGISISNPDRVMYAEQGLTKLGLAEYYAEVAAWMLPYLRERPLTLVRCPQGARQDCFYQKHLGKGAPAALRSVEIAEKSKVGRYPLVDDAAGLVSLVQIGVLEFHVWGARQDALEKPDMLVFDLDPDEALVWNQVIEAARELRELLEALGLQSFLKTTGGKGLHVVAPIRRRYEWPHIKQFAKHVAQALASRAPDRYTITMAKAARKGKIFIDYLRNERGATAVCCYSTRSRHGAPVATPITWDELSPGIRSDHFRVDNVLRRLRSLDKDPWDGFFTLQQSLTAAALKQAERAVRIT